MTTLTKQRPAPSARSLRSGAVSVIGLLAWAATAVAAWNLIAWGNRWYVVEVLLPPVTEGSGETWQMAYERVAELHATLVVGVGAALIAVALGLAWHWARRLPGVVADRSA